MRSDINDRNCLFADQHHGFRTNHSCLFEILDTWIVSVSQKEVNFDLFMFSKAFDLINPHLLFSTDMVKLPKNGNEKKNLFERIKFLFKQ